jgi:hypothetical protein
MKPWMIWDIERRKREVEIDNRLPLTIEIPHPSPDEKREKEIEFVIYYGNRIPSRNEVKEGTKGSRGYVVAAMGEDWAKMLEGV